MTKFFLPLCLVILAGARIGYAQSGPGADTTARYYARLARSANEADKSKLETQLV